MHSAQFICITFPLTLFWLPQVLSQLKTVSDKKRHPGNVFLFNTYKFTFLGVVEDLLNAPDPKQELLDSCLRGSKGQYQVIIIIPPWICLVFQQWCGSFSWKHGSGSEINWLPDICVTLTVFLLFKEEKKNCNLI